MPKSPYPHDVDKVYYETLARGILLGALNEEFGDIILHDKPDLLCYPGDIGVEVTQVMHTYAGMAKHFLETYKGLCREEIGEQKLSCFDELGYEPLFYKERFIGFTSKGMESITPVLLVRAFSNKLKKLKGYVRTSIVDLFMFYEYSDWFEAYHMDEFTTAAQSAQMNSSLKYRRAYVFQWNVLFICDLGTGEVRQIKIPEEFLKYCIDASRKMALG